MGRWANGYTAFMFDISDMVNTGDLENVIAVKVNHEDLADSRWYTGSGITKKVLLDITEKVHIEDYSTRFEVVKVEGNIAEVIVKASVKNEDKHPRKVILKQQLIDAENNTVMEASNTFEIESGDKRDIVLNEKISNPKLWSVECPYLYSLNTTILEENKIMDSETDKVGIRTFCFDSDLGFSLNGVSMKLKGVCVHEDGGCVGVAVPKSLWRRRLEKLKEMGCNAIRMSHNPHSQELYDLCDEMGFLVIDEIFDEWEGPKNKWSKGHNVYPPKHQGYYEDFHEWHEKDIESFILINRNRPSIILWSIGNEIDYPNDPYCHPSFKLMTGNNDANKPSVERQFNINRPNAERLAVIAKKLIKIVKRLDKTRPVTIAVAFPELSSNLGYFDEFDVIGYNYKEEFYEQDHKRFPDKAFLGSENGHHLEAWKAVTDHEYISGQFLWTGIDFLGEAHGWPIHASGAGVLTMAGFEKAGYYFRQSLWSDQPMIKILTAKESDLNEVPNWKHYGLMKERWDYQQGELIHVSIFTNMNQVELTLNDKTLPLLKKDSDTGIITCLIPYEAGVLKAEAIDNKMRKCVTDVLNTVEEIEQLDTRIYQTEEEPEFVQIEVQLSDTEGRKVCRDEIEIRALVEGEGRLIGLENGDIADTTPYTENYRSTYHGRLLVMVKKFNPNAKLTLTLEGAKLTKKLEL
ncbi:MAG: glycoside hydrolase family 2 protein [Anaerolineaceae bacterium]|nr:MAG: glycoside hydrolase family 2 protein [Anaerolineaceae bacterium]